ncbi:MAG TPA: GxxExxY protein [Candidatus Sulfotelmatobacter sp.]|nr:GxxExxY protein [Candidatus Sulfotelmatobacter sp.]
MTERVRLSEAVEKTAKSIVDSAFKVHKALGPGLLESVYEACLVHELKMRGHRLERQVAVPIVYEGLRLESGLRLDIVVDDEVIIEVKAVERDAPIFLAQVMSYLKLSNKHLGFVINFNVATIKEGIRRVVMR